MDGDHGALPRHYGHRARNWGFSCTVSAGLFSLLLAIWREMSAPRWLKVLCTVLLAVVLGWGLYGRSRRMTTVDREGIVVRGLHPPRRLAWDGIHDIRCVAVPPRRRWGPGTITYAYRTDGRRVPLLCVDDEELPALEPELASLRALLLRQRSAGWAPDPRAEPRIARQNAREEAWDRWFDGWRSYVLIFGVAAAVIAGIVLTGWLGGPA